MLLFNINILYNLANKKFNYIIDFILNKIAEIYKLNNQYIIYFKLLLYLLIDFAKSYEL